MRGYVANRYAKSLLEEGMSENLQKGAQSLLESAGVNPETAAKVAPFAAILPEFIPGIGESVGIDNTKRAINEGNYGQAAVEGGLTALGSIPVIGDLGKMAIFAGMAARTADTRAGNAALKKFEEQKANPDMDWSDYDQVNRAAKAQTFAGKEAGKGKQSWFVGPDSKPRFEISDDAATVNRGFTKPMARKWKDKLAEAEAAGGNPVYKMEMQELFNHSKLYDAYPQFMDMPVLVKSDRAMGGSMAGYSQPREGMPVGAIHLNIDSLIDYPKEEMIKSILHEAQHAVQQVEGFAKGTGSRNAGNDLQQFLAQKIHSSDDIIDEGRMREAAKLLNFRKKGSGQAEWVDDINYSMSAGEAEARAVELRRKLKPGARSTRHPAGDYQPIPGAEVKHTPASLFDFLDIYK